MYHYMNLVTPDIQIVVFISYHVYLTICDELDETVIVVLKMETKVKVRELVLGEYYY